jgi:hypothetical protein
MEQLLVSLFVGFLSGGVGGAIAAFLLRRIGKVDCDLAGWRRSAIAPPSVSYSFTAKFFNHREVPTALWNLRVALYTRGGRKVGGDFIPTFLPTNKVQELDLPPGVTVKQQLTIEGDADNLGTWCEDPSVDVKLEGTYTGGNPFAQRVKRETPSPGVPPEV